MWDERLNEALLNRRTWVLQERVVFPRVLHFAQDQLFWECHEHDGCESFPHRLPPALSATAHTRFKGIDPAVEGARLREFVWQPLYSSLNGYHTWIRLVTVYMRSEITREKDEFIAISGLANYTRSLLQDTCLGGVWLRLLPTRLLWMVNDCKQANGEASHRPATYRAPTWSWVSIKADIDLDAVTVDDYMVSSWTLKPTY